MNRVAVVVATLLLLAVGANAQAQANTDVYHVHFVKAALGDAPAGRQVGASVLWSQCRLVARKPRAATPHAGTRPEANLGSQYPIVPGGQSVTLI